MGILGGGRERREEGRERGERKGGRGERGREGEERGKEGEERGREGEERGRSQRSERKRSFRPEVTQTSSLQISRGKILVVVAPATRDVPYVARLSHTAASCAGPAIQYSTPAS